MIRYDRLWVTMEACGMTQYRLIKRHNFSAGQIGRLKKNMHVSTHTLDTLCTILGCGIPAKVEELGAAAVAVSFPGVAGEPPGFGELKRIIEDILPPHLDIQYHFWYLTWAELEDKFSCWRDIEDRDLTWSGLETCVI